MDAETAIKMIETKLEVLNDLESVPFQSELWRVVASMLYIFKVTEKLQDETERKQRGDDRQAG
jgi:hypothetical protein